MFTQSRKSLIRTQQEQMRQAKADLYVCHAQEFRGTLTCTQVRVAGGSTWNVDIEIHRQPGESHLHADRSHQ
jgi:hypothetical protein